MAIHESDSHPHRCRRAAAYVRMSTDQQELSIGFQMTAIQAYADTTQDASYPPYSVGYLRDVVCTRIKQAELRHQERKDIQKALLRSIVRRPSTGSFRYDCRLAIRVADKPFLQELRALCSNRNPWISGRALRMEKAIQRQASCASETGI